MADKHRLDHSLFRVPPQDHVRLRDFDPGHSKGIADKVAAEAHLAEDIVRLSNAQNVLWAGAEYAVVCIFQAMDAAGKDGTIKHVMSGLNPQGVEVRSFRAPTEEERLRPFLWRATNLTPARGRMAIFNRSYYEETLVVRVHPQFLDAQRLPAKLLNKGLDAVWQRRFDEINTLERWWAQNNILTLKFFLNVSREEQKRRFLERIDDPEKHWKFNSGDIRERGHWDEYMHAYEQVLSHTSTDEAPWYVIPADKKWYARAAVADIIATRIEALDLRYPTISAAEKAQLGEARRQLTAE